MCVETGISDFVIPALKYNRDPKKSCLHSYTMQFCIIEGGGFYKILKSYTLIPVASFTILDGEKR
jgi:hypothetical protein